MTYRVDDALVRQIREMHVPFGQLALWSLGQSGFVIKGGDAIAVIDPYLSDTHGADGVPPRRFPPPMQPNTLTGVSLVLTTHEHADHTDPTTLSAILTASPQANIVTTPQSRAILVSAGITHERIVVPRLGERRVKGGLDYQAVLAAHYVDETDGDGQPRWMGFVIICNGVTLYHAGDTILTPAVLHALDGVALDMALLPFNGRDFFREQQGIVGNLLPDEAVQFAAHVQANVLIGMHNDLFAMNRLRPGALFDAAAQYASWLRCHILQPGELYLYVQ